MVFMALSLLLQIPIARTHFSFTAVTGCGVNIEFFIAALKPLRVSLRSLHLDFRGLDLNYGVDDEEEFDDEGSLRGWPVLQTLSCSLMTLLHMYSSSRLLNLLPVGLRELEVLQPSCYWVAEEVVHIEQVLRQKEWAVPRLEKLSLVPGWGGSERLVSQLAVACEAAGVSLVEESFRW